MVLMAWRSLRSRWVATLASLLAVVVGTALVVAALVVGASAEAGGAAQAQRQWRLDGADLVVRVGASLETSAGLAVALNERPRLSEAQLVAVAGVPGVGDLALDAGFSAFVVHNGTHVGNGAVRSWGHSWATAVADPVRLTSGAAPQGRDEVAVDEAVARAAGRSVGDRIDVLTATGVHQYRLSGIVARAGQESAYAVFFDNSTAAELGGAPTVGLVRLDPGASAADVTRRIRASVPGVEVLSGADKGATMLGPTETEALAGGMGQFIGTMSACALLITVFVIASTLSLSVAQRRRELAMLRAVGASPGRVRRLVLGEAALLGIVGGLLGALAGVALAAAGLRLFAGAGLMPEGLPLAGVPSGVLAGLAAAGLTTIVAGSLPAWRASQVAPSEALRAVYAPPRRLGAARTVLGVVSAAVGVLLLVTSAVLQSPVNTLKGAIATSLIFTAAPFLVLGASLLGPVTVGVLLRLAAPVLGRTAGGFLAARSIAADRRRAVGLATPLMLMVAVACVLLFQDWATFAGKSRNYEQRLAAELVVAGPHMLGVPSVVEQRVATVPHVAAASGTVSSWVYATSKGSAPPNVEALGVNPRTISEVLDLPTVSGSWKSFDNEAVAVSEATATERGWRPGVMIDYRLPDGVPAKATVAVVYRGDNTLAGMLVPRRVLLPHLRDQFDTAVYLRLRPGVEVAAARKTVSEKLADIPGAAVQNRSVHLDTMSQQSTGDNWIVYLFVAMLAGYAGIAAINALIGSSVGQAPLFAMARLAGAKTRHVLGWIGAEAGFAALSGVVQGTVIAAAVMISYGYLLTSELWLPFPGGQYLLICATALLVAAVGALAPARLAVSAQSRDLTQGR
ncbi:ABC transporter permease [Pilimelia columellifera]|uniref:ABC transporter permease n=1 Tax=Pilimelia columellifera subsp. columellifera TaxID=706583 RepID=A0ABN3N2C0_9ACTN